MTVDELRQAVRDLPSLPEHAERFTWLFRRKNLREKILNDNPEEFLIWPVIKECCFVGNAPYIEMMIDDLFQNYDMLSDYLLDPGFGKPEYCTKWGLNATTGNLVSQIYHLFQCKGFNLSRGNGSIIEFGAGYGSMVVANRNLGFRGRYTIVDLPEFSLLQEYYLSNTISTDNIEWSRGNGEYDLLIAVCSLSEVDIKTRNSFLERVRARSYLIVFQPNWDGIDNMKYFIQLMNDNPQLEWRMHPNSHYQNHWYLIGKENERAGAGIR